jgi:uncharacterized protein (DUF433 family)
MLGQGIYTVAEVSRLTDLHPNRVRSWFKKRSDGSGAGPIFDSDYQPIDGDYAVSFYDLIDVLVAGAFRDQFHVPMQVIRRAHALLQKRLDTKHPFCHNDLYTDGRAIFLCAAHELKEDVLSEVVSRQQFFLHVRERLDHIDYHEITKLARRWKIAKGVVVDPLVALGKPTVENSGVTTYVIANQYEANARDGVLVADLYGVSQNDVANAVTFEKWYRRRHAA